MNPLEAKILERLKRVFSRRCLLPSALRPMSAPSSALFHRSQSLSVKWEFKMRRRSFITFFGGAAVASPFVAWAQPAMPVIGLLGGDLNSSRSLVVAFRSGLAETGYVEGRNVAIEYRWVTGQNDQLPVMLRDLIDRRVAVLAATTSAAVALAAETLTKTIPIVFRIAGDPVAVGLVASLDRPGGNITGATTSSMPLGSQRLEILRELLPAGATVALLSNPANASVAAETREIQAAARLLGLRLLVLMRQEQAISTLPLSAWRRQMSADF